MVLPFAGLFPGQGAQAQGMLCPKSDSTDDAIHDVIAHTINEANSALGFDLWEIVKNNPERLNQTDITQPAILTTSVALWRLWHEAAPELEKPTVLAGHSLGEYSALVCAESIAFQDAVRIVHERGRLMQMAVPEGIGAMAAILGLKDEEVESLCSQAAEKTGLLVSAANYNSIGQVVIAGNKSAVLVAIEMAKEAGAKRAVLLPVSVPSHCALMSSMTTDFEKQLAQIEIRTPTIPVIQNATLNAHSEPSEIRAALVGQLTQPVRWTNTIEKMGALPLEIKTMVEYGPGKVLSGLIKRINRAFSTVSVYDEHSLVQALDVLEEAK